MERLYKSFERPVLRGCRLRAERAQVLGLVGPPGAGKSVLLHILAGLMEADAGSVSVCQRQMVGVSATERRAAQANIGMQFQRVALFEHLSVAENIAFPLWRRNDPVASIQKRVEQQLRAVGLQGCEKKMPKSLSGGQRRRVGIARAAVTRPRILLCDEPAAGLDPVTSSRIFALLAEQKRRNGSSVVVVSSDVRQLFPICDKVAFLHEGRVLFQGSPAALSSSHHPVIEEFLGATVGASA